MDLDLSCLRQLERSNDRKYIFLPAMMIMDFESKLLNGSKHYAWYKEGDVLSREGTQRNSDEYAVFFASA